MKTIKINDSVYSYDAAQGNTLYKLANGYNVGSEFYGIGVLGTATGRTFDIRGNVFGGDAGMVIGISSQAATPAVTVDIGKTGDVTGGKGILSYGDGHLIRNAGTIDGNIAGIEIHGTQTIVNSGHISGYNAVDTYGDGDDKIVIRNSGTIAAESNGKAIFGGLGNETVINTGTIHGDVDLGGGGDHFTFKSGSIDGSVAGGTGNDIYHVMKAGLNIVEKFDEGTDEVFSSVTFELQVNVDDIQLTGKGNVDAIGNGGNNWMHGNSGKNLIYGWYGNDSLNGDKGNDIMTGGEGIDTFLFVRHGGRDTITDYQPGTDRIYMTDFKGFDDFTDMVANHAEEKANGDLWIMYGHDGVVLEDTTLADLKSGDFFFDAK